MLVKRYEHYKEVAALSVDQATALLRYGDAPERAWAVWSLGVQLGPESVPLLAPLVRHDPDAGVRRHVLTVFAGFGEIDALAAVVRSDPAAWVRAAAVRFLAALAGAWDGPVATLLVEVARSDRARPVRRALARALPPDGPPEVAQALASLCDDDDRIASRVSRIRLGQPVSLLENLPARPALGSGSESRYLPMPWVPIRT